MQPNPKYTLLDVLEKPIRGSNNLADLDGFASKELDLIIRFLIGVNNARSNSKTTSVMLGWQELTDSEQAQLTEHYSKHQIAMLGISICCLLEYRANMDPLNLLSFLRDMHKRNEGNNNNDKE